MEKTNKGKRILSEIIITDIIKRKEKWLLNQFHNLINQWFDNGETSEPIIHMTIKKDRNAVSTNAKQLRMIKRDEKRLRDKVDHTSSLDVVKQIYDIKLETKVLKEIETLKKELENERLISRQITLQKMMEYKSKNRVINIGDLNSTSSSIEIESEIKDESDINIIRKENELINDREKKIWKRSRHVLIADHNGFLQDCLSLHKLNQQGMEMAKSEYIKEFRISLSKFKDNIKLVSLHKIIDLVEAFISNMEKVLDLLYKTHMDESSVERAVVEQMEILQMMKNSNKGIKK